MARREAEKLRGYLLAVSKLALPVNLRSQGGKRLCQLVQRRIFHLASRGFRLRPACHQKRKLGELETRRDETRRGEGRGGYWKGRIEKEERGGEEGEEGREGPDRHFPPRAGPPRYLSNPPKKAAVEQAEEQATGLAVGGAWRQQAEHGGSRRDYGASRWRSG
eukprot:766976-Hanusia_phi.AAC.13